MKYKILNYLLLWLVIGTTSALASEKKTTSLKEKYEKALKGDSLKTAKGFITLHKVDDKVLVEIPFSELDKDLLLVSVVSKISDHTDAHPGVNPMAPLKVSFSRMNQKINLCRDKSIMHAEDDQNVHSNVTKSAISAIMYSYEIKAFNPDSTAALIDMTDLFIGPERLLSPIHARGEGKYMLRGVQYNHYKNGCFISDVKSFENNVSVTGKVTYTSKINAYTRYTTAEMERMLVKLPEEVMEKRIADYRLPLQVQGKLTYRDLYEPVTEQYYALRWNLKPVNEKAFRAGKKSEVVKPIVFYIDTTFTPAMRKGIIEGISEWNKVFDAIGFKDVIQFKDYPRNDSTFSPDNFQYNVIRYTPSLSEDMTVRTFADPRSGEILRTTISICHNYVFKLHLERLLHTGHADPSVRKRYLTDEQLAEEIKYNIMWSAGVDCFGVTYNLTSSAAFPVDSLRSATFTQRYGTTPSMLDNAVHNKVAPIDGATMGIRMKPVGVGEYDYFVFNWLYRPIYDKANEEQILRKMVDEKIGNPVYRYEYAKNCPDCGAGDVGDDDLLAAEYQLENLEYMFKNFDSWISDEEDPEFSFRGMIYANLVRRYKQIITQIAQNVYGIKTSQRMSHDPVPAQEYYPREHQEKALDMLFSHMLKPTWNSRPDLLSAMPLERGDKEVHKDYMMLMMNSTAGQLFAYEYQKGDHLTHTEYVKKQVGYVWANSRKGKDLTDEEIYFQQMICKTLLKSSKLPNLDNSLKSQSHMNAIHVIDYAAAFSDQPAEDNYNYPEDIFAETNIAGRYGELKKWPTINVLSTRHTYISLLKEIRKISLSEMKNQEISEESRAHYRYLVYLVNQVINE